MDDKVMELLAKILQNQTETNSRLNETNSRLDEANSRPNGTNPHLDDTNSQLKELTSRVQKLEAKVENDLGYKIKALFDAREIQNEKNDAMLNALERIENKIDILQMETAHVRKIK